MAQVNRKIQVTQHYHHKKSTEAQVVYMYQVTHAINTLNPVIGQQLLKAELQDFIDAGYNVTITEVK